MKPERSRAGKEAFSRNQLTDSVVSKKLGGTTPNEKVSISKREQKLGTAQHRRFSCFECPPSLPVSGRPVLHREGNPSFPLQIFSSRRIEPTEHSNSTKGILAKDA
jgi:hypothetical protein